jgi:hypothetical protein
MKRFAWVLGPVFLACGGGGGGTSDPGGQTDVPAVDPGITDPGTTDPGPSCQLAASLKGAYYHIDHLFVLEPAGPQDGIKDTLTQLWNGQIERDELIILFHVTEHDLATGKLTFEAGSGVLKDGKYQFIKDPAPLPIQMQITGCHFKEAAIGVLKIYPDLITFPIPVIDLHAEGDFPADGSKIEKGSLAGGICAEAAHKIDFKLTKEAAGCVNFFQFMDDLSTPPDKNFPVCTDDPVYKDMNGFTFKGNFDAHRTDNVSAELFDFKPSFECAK